MSSATLPGLLEALGELFLVPGSAQPWASFAGAPWATPALRAALESMAPRADQEVAYAGLFLAGCRRPTIHLEASVQRTGLLLDEAVLGELEALFEAAGVCPDPGAPPDHLGVLLLFLGHLLRRGGEGAMEAAARTLLDLQVEPLALRVASQLRQEGVDPFYAHAGRVLEATVGLCRALLG